MGVQGERNGATEAISVHIPQAELAKAQMTAMTRALTAGSLQAQTEHITSIRGKD